MHLQKKAIYNFVQLNLTQLQKEEAAGTPYVLEPWQKEDYRLYTENRLFEELQNLDIFLNYETLKHATDQFDSPEELTEYLTSTWDEQLQKDHVYLLLFELWRRLIPEKQSLTIACDELDYLIMLSDTDKLEEKYLLEDQLDLILEILDDNVDEGVDPSAAMLQVELNLANNLEDFLYFYILDLIDKDALEYANELLDGFYPYMRDKRWFDFLNVRFFCLSDPEEGYLKLEKLIHNDEKPDVQLNLEILFFLAEDGSPLLFSDVAKKTLSHLANEEDLIDFLTALSILYRENDKAAEEAELQSLIGARSSISLETPLDHSDPIFGKLRLLLPRTGS